MQCLFDKQGIHDGGDFVLYWMIATRRLRSNYALDRAIEAAEELRRPLLILEPVNVGYRWAADRHHKAILDGMREHDAELATSSVGYYPYVEPEAGAGKGLLAALARHACLVVTDDSPVFFTPQLLGAAARLTGKGTQASMFECMSGTTARARWPRIFAQGTPIRFVGCSSPPDGAAAPVSSSRRKSLHGNHLH